METCKTTLEVLVGAALSTDANTLGNNSGAKYTNRFVFDNKYSFEAYCLDDNNIWIQLCEVDGEESEVLIGHCLTINHNELLAPIYANFLWADFLSLVRNNKLDIDIEDFAINLLNCKEDDMSDRALHTVEKVFATATEYEKRDYVHFFMSSEYGPVYFNTDCLEFYAGAIHALSEDISEQVKSQLNDSLEFAKDNKNLSQLTGLTKADIKESANKNKLKLLDKILDIVDPDCFGWALDTYRAIEDAANAKCAEIASKPIDKSTAEAYSKCIKHFKEGDIDYSNLPDGDNAFAADLYNWQAQHRVSFDMQTLACIFDELGFNQEEFADELLRNDSCELVHSAYIAPSKM